MVNFMRTSQNKIWNGVGIFVVIDEKKFLKFSYTVNLKKSEMRFRKFKYIVITALFVSSESPQGNGLPRTKLL